jgi:dihydroneopterin aldolase/2-amino-4-hydroxy-6-hydroxymethyldihydropteridine diphosphokinase
MTDQIQIKDLLLRAIIGINPEEREKRQDVLLNLTLHADTGPAGASDDIEDAVNYRTLTKKIIDLVENSRFYLVEKMAAEIAHLCLDDPQVERVTVRVEKPGALRFARSVGVEIERGKGAGGSRPRARANRAFVALGSNIEPESHLSQAVRRLAACCRLLAVSRVYESEPVGKTDQPAFLNAAVLVETHLTAAEFKAQVLQAIERELGRVRTADKNAPRTIDLDISLWNDEVLEADGRAIPDPEILQWPYIARPLADLAPHHRHPGAGQSLLEIAQGLGDAGLKHRPDLVLWPA